MDGLGLAVEGLGFEIQGSGLKGLRFSVQGFTIRVLGFELWVSGFGFWVELANSEVQDAKVTVKGKRRREQGGSCNAIVGSLMPQSYGYNLKP